MTLPTPLGLIVSDAVWLAVIGGVSTVILAWMQKSTKTAIDDSKVNLRNEIDKSNAKLDEANEKRAVIHDLVNNNYSALAAEVNASNVRVEDMKKLVETLIEKLSAQETVRAQTALETPPTSAVPETLTKIEEHTEETAKNTARTDKAVAELGAVDAVSGTDPA